MLIILCKPQKNSNKIKPFHLPILKRNIWSPSNKQAIHPHASFQLFTFRMKLFFLKTDLLKIFLQYVYELFQISASRYTANLLLITVFHQISFLCYLFPFPIYGVRNNCIQFPYFWTHFLPSSSYPSCTSFKSKQKFKAPWCLLTVLVKFTKAVQPTDFSFQRIQKWVKFSAKIQTCETNSMFPTTLSNMKPTASIWAAKEFTKLGASLWH